IRRGASRRTASASSPLLLQARAAPRMSVDDSHPPPPRYILMPGLRPRRFRPTRGDSSVLLECASLRGGRETAVPSMKSQPSGPGRCVPVPPVRTSILMMAAPLVLSFGMRSLFTFVDIAFASTLGDAAIAAVGGLSFPYEILMTACWVGFSTGLTSNLSQAMGRRQGARIEQILAASRTVVWSLVPLFSAIALYIYFGAYHMGLAPDLARQFSIYGGVLIGGSAVTALLSIIPDSIV